MKKLFFLFLVCVSTIFADTLGGVNGYLANIPTFATCGDVLNFQMPTLTPEAAAILNEQGNPRYSISNAVDFDVASSTITYRVIEGSEDNVIQSVGILLPDCSSIDQNVVDSQIMQNTAPFANKINSVLNSLPNLSNQFQTDFNNTLSGVSSNLFTLRDTNFGSIGTRQSFLSDFLSQFKTVWQNVLSFVLLIGCGLGAIILAAAVILTGAKLKEIGPRIISGLLMIFIFFGHTGSGISPAATVFNYLVDKGGQLASVASGSATISEVKYSLSNMALADLKAKVAKATQDAQVVNNELPIVSNVLLRCSNTYDINAIQSAKLVKTDASHIFPINLSEVGAKSETEFYARFLLSNTNNNSISMNLPMPSISRISCAMSENQFNDLRNRVQKDAEIIANSANVSTTQLQNFTTSVIKGASENGWVGIALLPASHALAKSADSAIAQNLNQSAFDNFDIKHPIDSFKNIDLKRTIESDMQKVSLLFVPGVSSSIYAPIKDAAKTGFELFTAPAKITSEAAKGAVAGSSELDRDLAGLGTVSIAAGTAAYGASEALKIAGDIFANTVAFFITTAAAQLVLENLPYLVCIGVAGMVIALWHFEVLMFSLALPFRAASAFHQGQGQAAFDIAQKGISIAFKPILIVISVIVSVHCADFFHSITFGLISSQNDMLNGAANATLQATSWSISNPFGGYASYFFSLMKNGLIKGVLLIV
ncbi:MAG: hypothetical protein RL154_677, partial [Pseudomonadota bacterium]